MEKISVRCYSPRAGPPTNAMRGLSADEVSWGPEDTGVHDTAKVYALYVWVLKPSQLVAHFGLFLPQGTAIFNDSTRIVFQMFPCH